MGHKFAATIGGKEILEVRYYKVEGPKDKRWAYLSKLVSLFSSIFAMISSLMNLRKDLCTVFDIRVNRIIQLVRDQIEKTRQNEGRAPNVSDK